MTTLKSVYYLKETLKYMSEIDQSGVYKIRFENAGTIFFCTHLTRTNRVSILFREQDDTRANRIPAPPRHFSHCRR